MEFPDWLFPAIACATMVVFGLKFLAGLFRLPRPSGNREQAISELKTRAQLYRRYSKQWERVAKYTEGFAAELEKESIEEQRVKPAEESKGQQL